jgi:hypothetical protein
VLLVAAALLVASVRSALAAGSPPTTCAHLCPNLPQSCVVASTVTVVPGSIIDCGTRDVQVTGGDLVVHDGRFELRAGTVAVSSGHGIVADCPQATARQGFTLRTTGTVEIGTSGRLRANCDEGGGTMIIEAGGNVTIGGLGVEANGTAIDAPGGSVQIWSKGTVSVVGTNSHVDAKATGTNGTAAGGAVEIKGASISISETVTVSGVGHPSSGGIVLRASGDIAVDGELQATGTNNGNGGDVTIESSHGAVTWSKQINVRGVGSASTGGTLHVSAERIDGQNDVTASGGTDGGGIVLETRSDTLTVGTGPTTPELNADGGNGGTGGEIKVLSTGNNVRLYGRARCTDQSSGGDGGTIEVAGVSVTAYANSLLNADGAAGHGGTIRVEARDTMTLSGTLHAVDGMATIVYRSTAPTIGGGVTGPQTLLQDTSLDAPCGDGVRRQGVEQCDDNDVGVDANGNKKTCQTLGYTSGSLACLDTCLYDTSGCS